MFHSSFSAELDRDEAVLRFPFDERLRQLLRAIPGRRWDAVQRAWRIPLGGEQAQALGLLLQGISPPPLISEELGRALARARSGRRRDECIVELVRPDHDWWLGFATDRGAEMVAGLLEHPRARELSDIGRAVVPVDDLARALVERLSEQCPGLRLSPPASRALFERGEEEPPSARPPAMRHDVEFRRDRRGEHWILVAQRHASLARALARSSGLRALDGPEGTLGLAAVEQDAPALAVLLGQIGHTDPDPRVLAWLARATTWRGSIEVHGPRQAPVFLLLGDAGRLPAPVGDRATAAPGGATVPLTAASWQLIDEHLDGWLTPAARRCVEAIRQDRPAPPAVLERCEREDTFVLAPGHEPALVQAFAELPGALPPRQTRRPEGEHDHLPAIRADPFCVPDLDRFISEGQVWVDDEALPLLQEIREQHARSAGLVSLSRATEGELTVPGLGGELKPFQRAGVSYLLSRRRAFLADEQGLGKTIEALAALEADGAYPAVVVCPANLKLNWMREIGRWLPHRTVEALSGTGGDGASPSAEITVLNYEILSARLPALGAAEPQAVVLDESHYCKNPAAKRTQAVQRLCATLPSEGMVLALTGTPVLNRPGELISQLRVIGRLEDFGSGAQFGERFRGPDAHMRLHWHLRARCLVRRLKSEVLPQLPPKTRAVVPVELDNESEYRLAERDLIAWLRTQPLDLRELDARVAAALRAERLVRLNALKLLAARGKLHAALAWIHDFCSSGERLVVFAHHREVQRAILDRFPSALHILGTDSPAARDAALRAFQESDREDNQMIVCSMEVAGQGLTLTRSSSVAFLELDWTPAKHDQAEDRCHRIGQQDAVTAYYLLAADTVDETISSLLERKRAVIGAVTDGREEDEEGIVEGLVRELRGAPYRHLRAVA